MMPCVEIATYFLIGSLLAGIQRAVETWSVRNTVNNVSHDSYDDFMSGFIVILWPLAAMMYACYGAFCFSYWVATKIERRSGMMKKLETQEKFRNTMRRIGFEEERDE